MAKIVRIIYREMPMMQRMGDQCAYDKLYDIALDGEKAQLRAGSKSFDIDRTDFDSFVQLCENIGAADRILANNPWKMLTRFDGPGAMGSYVIVFDDGNAACADAGPAEIPQRFKELEKKYTPAGEPVIDGAWTCKCGQSGNTGKYCMECGMSFADGKES